MSLDKITREGNRIENEFEDTRNKIAKQCAEEVAPIIQKAAGEILKALDIARKDMEDRLRDAPKRLKKEIEDTECDYYGICYKQSQFDCAEHVVAAIERELKKMEQATQLSL